MTRLSRLFILGLLLSLGSTDLWSQGISGSVSKEKKFSIHLGTGYTSYTFADDDQDVISEHNNKWRNTSNYNIGFGYHTNPNWFFKLTGSLTQSDARSDSIVAISPTDTISGFLEDNVQLLSIGVTAERKFLNRENWNLGYLLGLEYFYLEDKGTFIQDEFTLTGGDIGMRAGLFFNVTLSNQLSLNFSGQYVIGILDNPSYDAINAQLPLFIESKDLSRLEFNIGLRFHILSSAYSKPKKPKEAEEDDEYVPNRRFE